MKPRPVPSEDTDPIAQTAAQWTIRHDRGLSAVDQDDFSQWLAADPRHRAAWAEHLWGWGELDRLAGLQSSMHAIPDPDLLAPHRSWRRRVVLFATLTLAAAAAVALGLFLWWPRASVPETMVASLHALPLIEQRQLADGSTVELNRGAIVTEHFTPGERRVRLVHGEAHFKVAKDTQRPFFVEAAGVAVRAVGTAFDVRLDAVSVEVLVTEGRVQVDLEDGARKIENGVGVTVVEGSQSSFLSPLSSGTILEAGKRAVVSLAPDAPAPQVATVTPAEIEARLAWQPRLLDFTNESLAIIVAEFNRRNPVRLTLGDPSLATLRLSATFRSDNVESFVRLLVSDFGMRAEGRDGNEIVLHKVFVPRKP